jgi:hypothetical protein
MHNFTSSRYPLSLPLPCQAPALAAARHTCTPWQAPITPRADTPPSSALPSREHNYKRIPLLASCPLRHHPPICSGKRHHRLSPILPPHIVARSPHRLPSSMCRSRSTTLSQRCSRNHWTHTSFTRAPSCRSRVAAAISSW